MTEVTTRAWAYLSRVVEPPCAELAVLVAWVGPVEAAERVRRDEITFAVHVQRAGLSHARPRHRGRRRRLRRRLWSPG